MGETVEKNNVEFTSFNIAQKLQKFGNTKVGNIFLKDANKITRITPKGKSIFTHGIANSGKTLRKTPFAIAGLGLTAYGGYKAKKTYDRYKPAIKIGRKVNDFLKRLEN